jgi:hypothetical protein
MQAARPPSSPDGRHELSPELIDTADGLAAIDVARQMVGRQEESGDSSRERTAAHCGDASPAGSARVSSEYFSPPLQWRLAGGVLEGALDRQSAAGADDGLVAVREGDLAGEGDQLVERIIVAGPDLRNNLVDPGLVFIDQGGRQVVLTREVEVDSALSQAGATDYVIETRSEVAVLVEGLCGGGKNSLARCRAADGIWYDRPSRGMAFRPDGPADDGWHVPPPFATYRTVSQSGATAVA